MLVRDPIWDKIRDDFSEEEKTALRAAIKGQVICPAGVVIDTDDLGPELARKLTEKHGAAMAARSKGV